MKGNRIQCFPQTCCKSMAEWLHWAWLLIAYSAFGSHHEDVWPAHWALHRAAAPEQTWHTIQRSRLLNRNLIRNLPLLNPTPSSFGDYGGGNYGVNTGISSVGCCTYYRNKVSWRRTICSFLSWKTDPELCSLAPPMTPQLFGDFSFYAYIFVNIIMPLCLWQNTYAQMNTTKCHKANSSSTHFILTGAQRRHQLLSVYGKQMEPITTNDCKSTGWMESGAEWMEWMEDD